MLMTETVTLRSTPNTTEYDDFGNPIPGTPTDVDSPAWVEPLTSREANDRQIQQTYGYVMYLPLEVDVTGADEVIYQGTAYEVVGEPQRQAGGFIVDGFQRVIVERTTG